MGGDPKSDAYFLACLRLLQALSAGEEYKSLRRLGFY
jgi:hypothetical protein